MKLLVTGSSGLIGSQAVRHFHKLGYTVLGVDNNLRAYFFGPDGDTAPTRAKLERELPRFRHINIDIRNRQQVLDLLKEERVDAIVHCAAQPSHDWAKKEPFVDFDVNAVGTLNLLEACRQFTPTAPFAFMSTNKVYGDAPNEIPLVEQPTRWEYADERYRNGIAEDMRLDRTTHSIFGASKVAADIMVQEYGRYFGMNTVAFRGGCLTGPAHASAELHGFLAYVVRSAAEGRPYTIFGYKGKQVRDNIHSEDVVKAINAFIEDPVQGAAFNLGGGRGNSISVLEAIHEVEKRFDRPMQFSVSETNRVGDHICYISDLGAIRARYPSWDVRISLSDILDEMCAAARKP